MAKYLFLSSVLDKTTLVHQFFIQATRLYPPFSDHKHHMPQPEETDSSSSLLEDEESEENEKEIIG